MLEHLDYLDISSVVLVFVVPCNTLLPSCLPVHGMDIAVAEAPGTLFLLDLRGELFDDRRIELRSAWGIRVCLPQKNFLHQGGKPPRPAHWSGQGSHCCGVLCNGPLSYLFSPWIFASAILISRYPEQHTKM